MESTRSWVDLEIDDDSERETIGDFGGVGSDWIGIGSASSGEKRGFPSRRSPRSRSEGGGNGRNGSGRSLSVFGVRTKRFGGTRSHNVERVALEPGSKP